MSTSLGMLVLMIVATGGILFADPAFLSTDLAALRHNGSSPNTASLFGAMLRPPLSVRDWMLVAGVVAFVAFNFFLWSLPISQTELVHITVPLGFIALLAFAWVAGR